MKHYGDITKLNGADLPIVDIITGGSPCQDLSVAGKRAGLLGERSGLFMEQIRIVKEMREHDKQQRSIAGSDVNFRLVRPRYMVWENVPGAFSSNKGEDFRCVLEEICRITDKTAVVPMPEGGKWSTSGCIMGDSWSVAWRVHDAQFWGVPQRRKRISLVADFGGESAPEILFERKSVSRDIEESREEGEGTSTDTERSVDKAISFQERAGKPGGGKGILIQNERTGALSTLNNQSVVYCLQGNGIDRADTAGCNGKGWRENQSYTLNTIDRPAVCAFRKQGHPQNAEQGQGWEETNVNDTLNIFDNSEGRTPTLVLENHPADSRVKISEDGIVQTLSSRMGTGGGNVPMVMENQTYQKTTGSLCASGCDKLGTQEALNDMYVAYSQDAYDKYTQNDKSATIKQSGGVYGGGSEALAVKNQSIVRRLTPLECERLQGYPDGWTDIGEWTDTKGKTHKDADSPRYKALGNSIALPFWEWMAKRMVKYIDHEPTMASLFDGIGGFPLVYSRAGCEPIWASEIEEFPIAVTKIRFPEQEETDGKEAL